MNICLVNDKTVLVQKRHSNVYNNDTNVVKTTTDFCTCRAVSILRTVLSPVQDIIIKLTSFFLDITAHCVAIIYELQIIKKNTDTNVFDPFEK